MHLYCFHIIEAFAELDAFLLKFLSFLAIQVLDQNTHV